MIKEVLIPCELHDEELNQHKVVDNAKHVLKDHCYWPLVSDLNNVLSHPSIAFRFMGDNTLLAMWFDFLKVSNFGLYFLLKFTGTPLSISLNNPLGSICLE